MPALQMLAYRPLTFKIFNTYNILDKLKYSFIITNTYLCTDEIYSDNHHPFLITYYIIYIYIYIYRVIQDESALLWEMLV